MDDIKNTFRTYHRRSVTRTSGYHVCEDTTGGECIILQAQKMILNKKDTYIEFYLQNQELVELFNSEYSIFGFGGYVYCDNNISVDFEMTYKLNDEVIIVKKDFTSPININDWNNIGFHETINCTGTQFITDIHVKLNIHSNKENTCLQFISFDMGIIDKDEFLDDSLKNSFYQKTSMHIPYLYYLSTDLPFETYLKSDINLLPR